MFMGVWKQTSNIACRIECNRPPNIVPLYINSNIPRKDRSRITKIRISAHKLNIETGRYARPKTKKDMGSSNISIFLIK